MSESVRHLIVDLSPLALIHKSPPSHIHISSNPGDSNHCAAKPGRDLVTKFRKIGKKLPQLLENEKITGNF